MPARDRFSLSWVSAVRKPNVLSLFFQLHSTEPRGLPLLRTIVVVVAQRAAQRVRRQVQRLAGVDDHRAADAALVDARLRRLVHLHVADDFRRQQGVVEGAAAGVGRVAAPVAGGDGLAIDQHAVQRRIGTVDADLLALAELAIHRDARQMRQRLGGVGVGELADVFGADRIDHGVGIALDVECLLQALAIAGDGDCLQFLRLFFLGTLLRRLAFFGGLVLRRGRILCVHRRDGTQPHQDACAQDCLADLHFQLLPKTVVINWGEGMFPYDPRNVLTCLAMFRHPRQ